MLLLRQSGKFLVKHHDVIDYIIASTKKHPYRINEAYVILP